jgi:hypothetical protein
MNNSNMIGIMLYITLVTIMIIGSNVFSISSVVFAQNIGNGVPSIGGAGGAGGNATSFVGEFSNSPIGGAGGAGGNAKCSTTGETVNGENGEAPIGSNGGNGGNGASAAC